MVCIFDIVEVWLNGVFFLYLVELIVVYVVGFKIIFKCNGVCLFGCFKEFKICVCMCDDCVGFWIWFVEFVIWWFIGLIVGCDEIGGFFNFVWVDFVVKW